MSPDFDGRMLGTKEGPALGVYVVGALLGFNDGNVVGAGVGTLLGSTDGRCEG